MTMRIETGPMTIANDWPGVFIRGDQALGYAANLRSLLSVAEKRTPELSENELAAWHRVQELADLLGSCQVSAKARTSR